MASQRRALTTAIDVAPRRVSLGDVGAELRRITSATSSLESSASAMSSWSPDKEPNISAKSMPGRAAGPDNESKTTLTATVLSKDTQCVCDWVGSFNLPPQFRNEFIQSLIEHQISGRKNTRQKSANFLKCSQSNNVFSTRTTVPIVGRPRSRRAGRSKFAAATTNLDGDSNPSDPERLTSVGNFTIEQ